MNKRLRNIGIATIVAGVLIYPALKLYEYLTKKSDGDTGEEREPKKTMRLLYHKKHTPHHQAPHNGHSKQGLA